MKTKWFCMALVFLPLAFQQTFAVTYLDDDTAQRALLTWKEPWTIEAGLVYTYMDREMEDFGNLTANMGDVRLGLELTPWWSIYGQVGASSAELDVMPTSASYSVGGLLGTRVNLWQLYEGEVKTSWRLTLQVDASYAYRTANDDSGSGDVDWSEVFVMLPVNYHLSFARTYRNKSMGEFHSLEFFVAPAFSKIDGTWSRNGLDVDFSEDQSFGVAAGMELWLTPRISFYGRGLFFGDASLNAGVRYTFR